LPAHSFAGEKPSGVGFFQHHHKKNADMGTGKSNKGEGYTCLLETRVTKKKYDELNAILLQSVGIRSLSELLRNILDNKPIAVRTYDATADSLLLEMATIRRALQGIGNNINQVTHRFHIEDSAEGKLYQALEVAKLYQQTDQKVTELFTVISKISEQWWPK
jgi:hypothetical protein